AIASGRPILAGSRRFEVGAMGDQQVHPALPGSVFTTLRHTHPCGRRIGKYYRESDSSRSLAKIGEGDNVAPMRELLFLMIHLLVTCTKLLRPGGVRVLPQNRRYSSIRS
ncbi:MAG: hypothetical protein QF609_11990, partial [Gammaproteobacteria bacterium]|nr:hypothetical protein [Gammaproteobacteria bacterium]